MIIFEFAVFYFILILLCFIGIGFSKGWRFVLERRWDEQVRGFWFGPYRIWWHGHNAWFWRPRYQDSWQEARIVSIAWLGFEFDYSYTHSKGLS